MTSRMPSPPADPWPRLFAEEPFVRELARALVGGDPDDVVQQTFLRALGAPRADLRQPRAWLARIVRTVASNLRRDAGRRVRRERAVAAGERVPSSAELLVREEQRQRLVRAVDALPPELRAVVLLRWFEALPPRRIAKELGLPVATVWNRLRSGLALLRERLDAEHGGDRRAWALPLAAFANGLPPAPGVAAAGTACTAAAAGVGGGILVGGTLVTMQTKVAVAFGAVALLALAFVCWPRLFSAGPDAPPRGPGPAAVASAPAPMPREDAAPAAAPERQAVVAAPPATTGSLLVRVRHADGTPASDVTAIVGAPFADFRVGRRRAACDADGAARFDGLAPGPVRVRTNRPSNTTVDVEIEAGRTTEVLCKLDANVTIRGIVVDREQRPVPSALVEMAVPAMVGYDIETVATTGSDGRFTVRAAPALCAIGARAAGFAASKLQVLTGKDGNTAEVRIELPAPGGSVEGRVEDAAGTPVAGAVVCAGRGQTTAIAIGDEGAPAAALARTDADGRFVAVGLEPGEQTVQARGPGFAPWHGAVSIAAGATSALRIVLLPGGAVRGVVLDADRRPVAEAQVTVGTGRDFASFRTETDESGAFALSGLPVGEVQIAVATMPGGRADATVSIAAGQVASREVVIPKGRELKGRVVDVLGAPVDSAGVEVIAEGRPAADLWFAVAKTGADGAFAVGSGPAGGTFRVDVWGAEIARLRVEGIDFHAPVELRVRRIGKPDARITGVVHDADGRPQANAEVDAWSEDPRDRFDFVATDMQGRFEFGPVHAGSWEVRARAPGGAEARTGWHDVAAASVWDTGVIRLGPGGTAVVVPSGDAKLVAAAANGYCVFRGAEFLCGMSRQDGLRSPLLAPGEYHLRVRGEGAVEQLLPFTIRSGEDTRIDVALQSGIRQRLDLAPPAGFVGPRSGECVLHRDAELATAAWPHGAAGQPIEAVVWLRPGSYSLAARLGDLRGAAAFRVGDREGEPVVVPMR
jgi:RNA polymerase sigma factor (sigma-70 family)